MQIMTPKEAAANLRAAADKIEQLEIDCEVCVDLWFHAVKSVDMLKVLRLADGETESTSGKDGKFWHNMEIAKCRSTAFYDVEKTATGAG